MLDLYLRSRNLSTSDLIGIGRSNKEEHVWKPLGARQTLCSHSVLYSSTSVPCSCRAIIATSQSGCVPGWTLDNECPCHLVACQQQEFTQILLSKVMNELFAPLRLLSRFFAFFLLGGCGVVGCGARRVEQPVRLWVVFIFCREFWNYCLLFTTVDIYLLFQFATFDLQKCSHLLPTQSA
jgi:hypothetical protein